MSLKEEAEKLFANDLYATKLSGIVIEEVEPAYAKCSMQITPDHLNAMGFVMGGAILTIADFTFAVASNMGNPFTVTMNSNASFIAATKAKTLYCEAKCLKNGRGACFFEMLVTDSDEKIIATVSSTGYRKTN